MSDWTTLTDEQRESARATMRAAIEAAREEGYEEEERAHEAALAALADRGDPLRPLDDYDDAIRQRGLRGAFDLAADDARKLHVAARELRAKLDAALATVQTLANRAEKAEASIAEAWEKRDRDGCTANLAMADRADAIRALASLVERTGNLLTATSGAGDFGETWTTTNAALREARAVLARLTAKGIVQ